MGVEMKTDIQTWRKAFKNMRGDWENKRAKTGDAAFAALERLMPGLEDMWYKIREFERRIRYLENEIEKLKSISRKESR
jgi:phytoene dehydrogenase-like protein